MSAVSFDLVAAERDLEVSEGFTTSLRRDGLSKSPVTYLEFAVDGAPLLQQLRAGADFVLDYVGVIQDGWPIESVAAIERLLGHAPGDLPDGRVSLYVCPECGDLGCGAITANLEFEPEVVTWRAFGIQTDNDPTAAPLQHPSGARMTDGHTPSTAPRTSMPWVASLIVSGGSAPTSSTRISVSAGFVESEGADVSAVS